MKYKLGRSGLKAILDKATDMYKGSLFNYVDQNLSIIDHLHTHSSYWWRNLFTVISKDLHNIDISTTTQPPTYQRVTLTQLKNDHPSIKHLFFELYLMANKRPVNNF